jgi:hypothetical protein
MNPKVYFRIRKRQPSNRGLCHMNLRTLPVALPWPELKAQHAHLPVSPTSCPPCQWSSKVPDLERDVDTRRKVVLQHWDWAYCCHLRMYRVYQELRSILQDLMPEEILCQKCRINLRPIRNCYWVGGSWIVGDVRRRGHIHAIITTPLLREIADRAVSLCCEKYAVRSNCQHAVFPDVHFVYGFCNGNATAALEEYLQRRPRRRIPGRSVSTNVQQ